MLSVQGLNQAIVDAVAALNGQPAPPPPPSEAARTLRLRLAAAAMAVAAAVVVAAVPWRTVVAAVTVTVAVFAVVVSRGDTGTRLFRKPGRSRGRMQQLDMLITKWAGYPHLEEVHRAATAATDDEFRQLCCSALEFVAAAKHRMDAVSMVNALIEAVSLIADERDVEVCDDVDAALKPMRFTVALFQATPESITPRERWEMVQSGRVAATACGGLLPVDADSVYHATGETLSSVNRPRVEDMDWAYRWEQYRRLEAAGPAAVEIVAALYKGWRGGIAELIDTAQAVLAKPDVTA